MTVPDRTMHVSQVDERDTGWEDPAARFRAYLHGSGRSSTVGGTDTYEVTGADVLQVIAGRSGRPGTDQRMLRRRVDPVGIPKPDRAPESLSDT